MFTAIPRMTLVVALLFVLGDAQAALAQIGGGLNYSTGGVDSRFNATTSPAGNAPSPAFTSANSGDITPISGDRAPAPAPAPAPMPSGLAPVGAATRAEVTKKVWDYIKANRLQDQQNKRQINADDKLKPIFGGKSQVSMFEMTKLVNSHLR